MNPFHPSFRLPRVALAGIAAAALALPSAAQTQKAPPAALVARLQAKIDSIHAGARFPGATFGFALPDGTAFALAVGQSDTTAKLAMRPADRLLSGSVGKTYVAAVALQLVGEGKLELDAPVARYLGGEPWYGRLPNARDITVRQVMSHTSGLVRYELNERFLRDLTASPDREWTVEERLAYLFDAEPPFAAGQGWDYSDTNYIVLGAIIEKLTGARLNDEIARRVLRPLGLANTVPSESRRINGLAHGYAGPDNPFGGSDAMLKDGVFAINPQFEWAGGGYASTADDLARWARALYEGKAFDASLLPQALDGVDASRLLGPGARYGLGVIVRPTQRLGPSYGHSGFFPGYIADVRYYPEHRVAVALQVNTSAGGALGRSPGGIVNELAELLVRELEASSTR